MVQEQVTSLGEGVYSKGEGIAPEENCGKPEGVCSFLRRTRVGQRVVGGTPTRSCGRTAPRLPRWARGPDEAGAPAWPSRRAVTGSRPGWDVPILSGQVRVRCSQAARTLGSSLPVARGRL